MSLEELERLPHSTFIMEMRGQFPNVSLAQSKEALIGCLTRNIELPLDPMAVVRKRNHDLIAINIDQLRGRMDRECEDCFDNGQQKCHDIRAIVDYLKNFKLIDIDET